MCTMQLEDTAQHHMTVWPIGSPVSWNRLQSYLVFVCILQRHHNLLQGLLISHTELIRPGSNLDGI